MSKKISSNNFEKLVGTLSDAQVDLNPHQIEAALFAFKTPFSKGIIIADEVGLGKTISSGIVIAQKWAEQKRKILIIVPANLRKQWQIELDEKFYLSSIILDGDYFKQCLKSGFKNPFIQNEIIITSYHFANTKAEYISTINWDMVVIDEAHKLRNVHKTDNVIARSIRNSLGNCFKLLITATPLQNSLLELYGLVSFIDNYTFGDIESFKSQFLFLREHNKTNKYIFDDLVTRLKTMCTRTLRRQALEYIKYTERLLITQEFVPTNEEQELYDRFSSYLQRDRLWALPNSGRHLISMILWKLLSSSTFAIAQTMETLATRLEIMLESGYHKINSRTKIYDDMDLSDYEEEELIYKHKELTQTEKISLKAEIDELKSYSKLANSIKHNAKGDALVLALEKGFQKLKELKAPEKAVIFTESRRTQLYILNILKKTKFKNKIVFFNGGLTTIDKRQFAINEFKNNAQIMIATEAAAEGLNLQFCSMIINYDLPFNPQRIEQRIGRCHRYGQKNDVVVINFLNKNNIADQRVYKLLCDKFNLFEGVFGASDEILGTIDALDFEKRIIEIYQKCRTIKEIEDSFNSLRASLEPEINEKLIDIKKRLLENFDTEVSERLKLNTDNSTTFLNRYEKMLWSLTKYFLDGFADFEEKNDLKKFTLNKNPFGQWYSPIKQTYIFDRAVSKGQRYRLNNPLAKHIIEWISQGILDKIIYGDDHYQIGDVIFDITNHSSKISVLEKLKGKTGYLQLNKLSVKSLELEDILIFTGYLEDGTIVFGDDLKKLFDLPAVSHNVEIVNSKSSDFKIDTLIPKKERDKLNYLFENEKAKRLSTIEMRNNNFFDDEIEKLDKWAKDIKQSIEKNLKNIDNELVRLKQESRKAVKLNEKLAIQKLVKDFEAKRNKQRFDLYVEQDKIDDQKEKLIEDTQKLLEQIIEVDLIFIIKWRIV